MLLKSTASAPGLKKLEMSTLPEESLLQARLQNQTLRALGLPVLEKKRVFREIRAMVEASMKEPRDLMEVFVIDLSEES